MMKKILVILLILPLFGQAQTDFNDIKRPKLVVGIVVDQMRPDYLYRYYNQYEEQGFKKLLRQGTSFNNCFINFLPTYTGPGHASIYTGSVPSIHGIAGNNWTEAKTGERTYCVTDKTEHSVGGIAAAGQISPRNMKTTSVTDALRLATNLKSKTIAMSLKDRGAVLPGGHTSNGTYWMDDSLGEFMTSSFYTDKLPRWASSFNAQKKAAQYLKGGWLKLYSKERYINSTADNNAYEGRYTNELVPTFPHRFDGLNPGYIKKTTFGNDILFDFAKAAIQGESLGQGESTDFLAISFSSTDYVGHYFGLNSVEAEDMYLRFDKLMANFLSYLDAKVGKGNYLLFLTADHGAAHNPTFMQDQKVPAGLFKGREVMAELGSNLQIQGIENNYAYLFKGAKTKENKQKVIDALLERDDILFACDAQDMRSAQMPKDLEEMAINSYCHGRSGDVFFVLNPGILTQSYATGTTHGVWNPYDAHIPLIFYGWNIQSGIEVKERVQMTDIAATIANLLHITPPNGCIGRAILPLKD